jgi:hypothetical protein
MPMKLTRRTLLKGLLGGAAVSVALPTLDLFLNDNGTAMADGTALPRRFGVFFWGNGVIPTYWNPTGEGTDWQLSEQMMPLAPMKHKLSVVSGMRVNTGNDIAHASGAAGILSGAALLVNNADSHTFSQPSIDQVVAQALGGTTRFRSVEVTAQAGASGRSHNGPDSVNPPESSPFALYQRLFGDGFVAPGDDPIIDPRLGLRRSVLDAVMADSNRLSNQVGAADRQRLDQHFTAIRDLEKQLAILEEDPPDLASCERPMEPAESYPDIDGRPQLTEINAAMSDLLAMALACDQTRVFSYWFTDSVNNLLFPVADAGHHRLTHDEPGDQPQVNAIVIHIMERLNELLQRLDAVPEGAGTLLDNCGILATTDCSLARQHLMDDYPIILAGSCCGALNQGIHYRSQTNENASKVLLSLLRAMGLNLAEFGTDAGLVSDGLAAIEAGAQP